MRCILGELTAIPDIKYRVFHVPRLENPTYFQAQTNNLIPMPMEVICLEDAALYSLVEQVTAPIKEKLNKTDKWISDEEAMKKLNITSKITNQKGC